MKKRNFNVCRMFLFVFVILIMGCSKEKTILDSGQGEATINANNINMTVSEEDICNWIGRYPDDAKIANLTLLGSHDTGARDMRPICKYFAQCQSYNYKDQIRWGARVFDCRLSQNMNFFHGETFCDSNFRFFASACIDFLRENPKEFLIVLIKAENCDGDGSVFNRKFQENVDELGRNFFIFEKDLLNQPISKYRGKMVIVTRYKEKGKHGYIEGAPQINWPDQPCFDKTSDANGCISIVLGDRYECESGTKVVHVKRYFSQISSILTEDPTRWCIFFTSGYNLGTVIPAPRPSTYTNEFRNEKGGLQVLKEHTLYLKKGGTIMFDFVDRWTELRDYIFVHTAPSPKSVSE